VSFTPPGGVVEMTVSTQPNVDDNRKAPEATCCTIRVTDTGPGIPVEKLDHVFEAFVQVTSDGQAARKGSGLGLTVSRQLAQLMGGDITVASSGEGAAFTLWLVEGGVREAEESDPAGELLAVPSS
jgi:signal transduction histidine kinase